MKKRQRLAPQNLETKVDYIESGGAVPMSEAPLIVSCTPMNRSHYPALCRIEHCGAPPFWEEDHFKAFAKEPANRIRVAEYGQNYDALGFIAFKINKDHIRIINIGVRLDSRRKRVGYQLVNNMAAKHADCPIASIVMETNLETQLFLKSIGFRCTTILKGRFRGRDGYRFERDAFRSLSPQPQHPETHMVHAP